MNFLAGKEHYLGHKCNFLTNKFLIIFSTLAKPVKKVSESSEKPLINPTYEKYKFC